MIRQRHYSPSTGQPHSSPLRPGFHVGKFVLATRQRHLDIEKRLCGICLAAAEAFQLASRALLAHISRQARPPSRPPFRSRFVTRSRAGQHTAIVPRRWKSRPSWHRALPDGSVGGELAIIDATRPVILQPDEETLASYRHEPRTAHPGDQAEPLPICRRNARRVHIELWKHEFLTSGPLRRSRRGRSGLYRTILYLGADIEPTEEVHFQHIRSSRRWARSRCDSPTRADKMPNMANRRRAQPGLGLRSIACAANRRCSARNCERR